MKEKSIKTRKNKYLVSSKGTFLYFSAPLDNSLLLGRDCQEGVATLWWMELLMSVYWLECELDPSSANAKKLKNKVTKCEPRRKIAALIMNLGW